MTQQTPNIDWDDLADAYRAAQTEQERADAYQKIVEAFAADPDLDEDADLDAGADAFLRERGLMR
jgi:hypothetical protein